MLAFPYTTETSLPAVDLNFSSRFGKFVDVDEQKKVQDGAEAFIQDQPVDKRGLVQLSRAFASERANDLLGKVLHDDAFDRFRQRLAAAHTSNDKQWYLKNVISSAIEDCVGCEREDAADHVPATLLALQQWLYIVESYQV